MSSSRENILVALENALGGISTANGYANTVAEVTRHFRHYSEMNTFPALVIISGPGDISIVDGRRQVEREAFSIGIRGYAKANRDISLSGKLSTALESLIADIRKCIAANRNLGLSFVFYTEVKTIDPYIDWKSNIGICDVIIEVNYKYLAATP